MFSAPGRFRAPSASSASRVPKSPLGATARGGAAARAPGYWRSRAGLSGGRRCVLVRAVSLDGGGRWPSSILLRPSTGGRRRRRS
eukprot:7513720-Pyramimonas_sp.AAC.1